jgi:hypothetical protein
VLLPPCGPQRLHRSPRAKRPETGSLPFYGFSLFFRKDVTLPGTLTGATVTRKAAEAFGKIRNFPATFSQLKRFS